MTYEEAKKMGATHVDDFGNYYKAFSEGAITIWNQLIGGEWCNCQSMFFKVKPL